MIANAQNMALIAALTVGHVSASTGSGNGGDTDGGEGDGRTTVENPETLDAIVEATASRNGVEGMLLHVRLVLVWGGCASAAVCEDAVHARQKLRRRRAAARDWRLTDAPELDTCDLFAKMQASNGKSSTDDEVEWRFL
eukprot:6194925-Pleurochrysis_carterae.AAC.1